MRVSAKMVVAALAVSASACTLWYALNDPYAGDGDGGGDAEPVTDSATDVPITDANGPDISVSSLTPISSNVGSIAVFGETLYANVGGQLATCSDSSCESLKVIVAVDASYPDSPGLAVDDAGVFWLAGDGIWASLLDGSDAGRVIQDQNLPYALAADGTRLSWTTHNDAGAAVINSCAVARKGCTFEAGTAMSGTGNGGAVQLVDGSANLDHSQLAAGPGYVLWAAAQSANTFITFTPVDGGAWTTVNPRTDDNQIQGESSTTFVTSDGTNAYYSFFDSTDTPHYFVVELSRFPNKQGQLIRKVVANKSFCMNVSHGAVGSCPTGVSVVVSDEFDGGTIVTLTVPSSAGATIAANANWIFYLDSNYTLWRYPR